MVYTSIMDSTFSRMLTTYMHINVCLVRRTYPWHDGRYRRRKLRRL